MSPLGRLLDRNTETDKHVLIAEQRDCWREDLKTSITLKSTRKWLSYRVEKMIKQK
jgi:hypothetical protein